MKRMWPEELNYILDDAEEVTLDVPASMSKDGAEASQRAGLKVRMTQQDFERIWPLAEARYRLDGRFAGKAITLITNNPHYQQWHPADGGTDDAGETGGGGQLTTKYVIAYFLLDDVREAASAT